MKASETVMFIQMYDPKEGHSKRFKKSQVIHLEKLHD